MIRALRKCDPRAPGRAPNRTPPRLEILEARNLLSGLDVPTSHSISAAHVRKIADTQDSSLYQYSLHKHPLNEKIVGGHVKKVPMFYGPYAGPKRPDLDAIGANGRLIFHQGFVFTGEVLGAIDSSQPSYYVFGINRGGAAAPGPFPNRAMIYFDAEVIVATGPNGVTGTVQLLNSSGQPTSSVNLPPDAVVINGNQVQVSIAASLLPSTSPRGTHQPESRYFYAFWAGTSPSATSGIASFAPEYAITYVNPEGFPKG
jgi:hypothetical protein